MRRKSRKEMKPPHDNYISQDHYNAACQDRDRWAQMAMEQHQYIRQLEQQIQTLQKQIQTLTQAEDQCATLPPENDYHALVQWLAAEKTLGNDHYAEAGFNRSEMCRRLSRIIGWDPDQNSLRKAENR